MVCITAEELLSINTTSISAMSHSEVDAHCISLADHCGDLLEKLNKKSQNSSISSSAFIPTRVAAKNTVSTSQTANSSKDTQTDEADCKVPKIKGKWPIKIMSHTLKNYTRYTHVYRQQNNHNTSKQYCQLQTYSYQ